MAASRAAAAAAEAVEEEVGAIEVSVGSVIDVGRDAMSLKTCFGSRNLGSMCFGAIKSRQTTKISAETLLQKGQIPRRGSVVSHIPRRRRFRCFYRLEKLTKDPEQTVIILTSENLGNKTSALGQKFCGKFQTLQNQLVLSEGILDPCTTNVGSTVMKN